jgi:hypothetical protein
MRKWSRPAQIWKPPFALRDARRGTIKAVTTASEFTMALLAPYGIHKKYTP